jgi:hypothetical protein
MSYSLEEKCSKCKRNGNIGDNNNKFMCLTPIHCVAKNDSCTPWLCSSCLIHCTEKEDCPECKGSPTTVKEKNTKLISIRSNEIYESFYPKREKIFYGQDILPTDPISYSYGEEACKYNIEFIRCSSELELNQIKNESKGNEKTKLLYLLCLRCPSMSRLPFIINCINNLEQQCAHGKLLSIFCHDGYINPSCDLKSQLIKYTTFLGNASTTICHPFLDSQIIDIIKSQNMAMHNMPR